MLAPADFQFVLVFECMVRILPSSEEVLVVYISDVESAEKVIKCVGGNPFLFPFIYKF